MLNKEEDDRIKALEDLVAYLEDRLAALELIALSYPEKEEE
jgi:hypothetical protein